MSDIKSLTSKTIGELVESEIRNLILAHGGGELGVFKPTADTEVFDIVLIDYKQKALQPIYIQVKGHLKDKPPSEYSYAVKQGFFEKVTQLDRVFFLFACIEKETFILNPEVLLIPSKLLKKEARERKTDYAIGKKEFGRIEKRVGQIKFSTLEAEKSTDSLIVGLRKYIAA